MLLCESLYLHQTTINLCVGNSQVNGLHNPSFENIVALLLFLNYEPKQVSGNTRLV